MRGGVGGALRHPSKSILRGRTLLAAANGWNINLLLPGGGREGGVKGDQ